MSNQAFGRLLFGLIAQNWLFIGVTLAWMRRRGRNGQSIRLECPTRRQVLLAIGGGIAVAVGSYWLGEGEIWLLRRILLPTTFQHLQQFTDAYGAERAFQQLPHWWMMACFALVGSLLAPIGEEMLFRGLIYYALQEKLRLRTRSAIVVSALLFALVHVSPLNLLPLFAMGIAFAVCYTRTNSLWVPIGMHAVSNALNFLLLMRNG